VPEFALTLAALTGLFLAGCSGGGNPSSPDPQRPATSGPVVVVGPEFSLAASKLDVRILALRDGEQIPPSATAMVKAQSESLPEPLRVSLADRGFLGALMPEADLAELERILTTTPAQPQPPAPVPPPPTPPTAEGTGTSIVGGPPPRNAPPPEPKPEPIVTLASRPAVSTLSSVTVKPGAAWTPLVDAPTRLEPWALSLGSAVASLKPGTLRWFVRTWPAPAEPIPTAGMTADLRVQFLPVLFGPGYEAAIDPLAPPPLSSDLSLRGQVVSRQAFTCELRNGAAMVLLPLPMNETRATPGPAADNPPMLGQALLGPGPAPTPTARPTGPRVLVLRPVVPGTYRLLLDRPTTPPEAPR